MLLFAGVIEVIWVSGLKHSSTWWEWLITAVALGVSFMILIKVSARLPIGTVYAVFTGLGTAGTVIAEMLIFGEPANPLKLLFIATLAAGVMGLKLVTKDVKEGEA